MKKISCVVLSLVLTFYPYVPILGMALAETASDSASIVTGDGVAISESATVVNTTLIDSTIQINNILIDDPSKDVEPDTASPSSNIAIENEVDAVTTASAEVVTGQNVQEATGSGQIASTTTGEAVAIASAVTVANSSLVNSSLELYTVAVTSSWEGDLVVEPMLNDVEVGEQADSPLSLTINNEGNVETTAQASANTGNNTQIASGSSELVTGDASALAQATTITNATLVNTDFFGLVVSNIHLWTGNILNFLYPGSVMSAQELWYGQAGSFDCTTNGCTSDFTVENDLDVSTIAIATANTGDNLQNSGGDGEIRTGNALAIASATTIANTTLLNSRLRIYQLLLMAPWSGNLVFDYPKVPAPEQQAVQTTQANSSEDEKGDDNSNPELPQIVLTSKNNVGEYIFAGDGVRYELVTTNQGPIDVQDAVLFQAFIAPDGSLIRQVGGYVGAIALNKSRTISFILNTAKEMPAGEYATQSYIIAKTDRGAEVISNVVSNPIPIKNRTVANVATPQTTLDFPPQTMAVEDGEVLGSASTTDMCGDALTWPWYLAVLAGSIVYFVTNLARQNDAKAAKLGLVIPFTGYAGLLLSYDACQSGLGVNFLVYAFLIYGVTATTYGVLRMMIRRFALASN